MEQLPAWKTARVLVNCKRLNTVILGRHLRADSRFARKPASLARFARNPFENLAAEYWDRVDLKPLSACQDEQERGFLFKCVYVPLFAALRIDLINRTVAGDTKFWLYEPATYLNAWERMHLEMVLSLTCKPENTYRGVAWEKPFSVRSFNDLPKPTMEWFLRPPGERSHWIARLDEWRKAAEKSFLNFLASVNPQIDAWGAKELKNAAVAGTIQRLSAFPPRILGKVLASFAQSRDRALEVFFKDSTKPAVPNTSFYPKLDGWLVEFWPSIWERKWKYRHVSRIAARKFNRIDKQATAPSGIEARCDRLELKLHPSARRGGRARTLTGDPFELMGGWLECFASQRQAWISGQRGLASEVEKLVVNFL